jgi:hypothetical protein
MLKLSSAVSLASLASAAPALGAPAGRRTLQCRNWEVFELSLQGLASGIPFRDVNLSATFALDHKTVLVNGFYDGAGNGTLLRRKLSSGIVQGSKSQ